MFYIYNYFKSTMYIKVKKLHKLKSERRLGVDVSMALQNWLQNRDNIYSFHTSQKI